ncbi:hypothetical protein G6F37_011489 [Rhizopus arrhizus]|nr:hypothetical protein G6F38_011546 [Rhizopus arrhizus]KAG1149055.1 hypothetical protein G6F37_011489 [Rhizopus arrhizus]
MPQKSQTYGGDTMLILIFVHQFCPLLYVGESLQHALTESSLEYLDPSWSDHSILHGQFDLGASLHGPGMFRGNPAYASNPQFQQHLSTLIDKLLTTLSIDATPQEQWEQVKTTTTKAIKSFGVKYVCWRKTTLKHLQRKRNRLLRSKPPIATLQYFLPKLERMIYSLQTELVEISALKAGAVWREKGERSAKYLKQVHTKRETQQFIRAIQSPSSPPSNESNDTMSGLTTTTTPVAQTSSDPTTVRQYAHQFYSQLYSKDPVENSELQQYLASIQFPRKFSEQEQGNLIAPITIDMLVEQASRITNKQSSPGSDGLSYPFLLLLFKHPGLSSLCLQIYNQALDGVVPDSWQDIRVRLLPKKGDLTSLRNWRPISLINCDAKVFTRILTKRLGSPLRRILNPYQSGFVPGKFIGDNGLALSMILEQSRGLHLPGVGLLLDQEKAYDRVHPGYLQQVMSTMDLPDRFINCIQRLFFGNRVSININGFFTESILQERGLRQGDPLSPLLFNIALEPFLLSILQDPCLPGLSPTSLASGIQGRTGRYHPNPVKCLAYADDVCLLLTTPQELEHAKAHMDNYARVSNAKFNENKTEVFSLNGPWDPIWNAPLQSLNITTFHHQSSLQPFRYLGFYFPYNTRQRKLIEGQLLLKVQQQCIIYSKRQLSILGRVTIINVLILSKVWYTLRLLRPTARFFSELKKLIYQFVWQKKFPKLKSGVMFLPSKYGGLNVLDPSLQHRVLQKRWLNYLLDAARYPTFVRPYMLQHLALFQNASEYPLLPLLCARFRVSAVYNKAMSIWSIIFETIDYFIPQLTTPLMGPIPLATLLNLPLFMVLQADSTHWSHRHPKFLASSMFIFDNRQERLRLRVDGEYTRYPRLCRQLFQDILTNHTVSLLDVVWDHILTAPAASNAAWSSNSVVLSAIRESTYWASFTPQKLRLYYQDPKLGGHNFTPSLVRNFWRCTLYSNARTVYYRTLQGRIPTQLSIHKYNPLVTATCSICGQADDTFRHFVIDCPKKWEVWQAVLHHHYPSVRFSPELIYGALRYLHVPSIPRGSRTFFTIIGTTHWQLWNMYWTHGNTTTRPISASSIQAVLRRILNFLQILLSTS